MAKQRVGELPKEEQEKLIAEMKEHELRGVLTAYTVEGALAAIEKAKAAKANSGENEQSGDGQTSGENEQSGDGQTSGENEQSGDGQTSGENEQSGDGEQKPDENEQKDENKQPEKIETKPAAPALRCHICRSEVFDGVCSGCGFTLKR